MSLSLKLQEIEGKLQKLQLQIIALKKEKQHLYKRKLLRCCQCGKQTRLDKLTYFVSEYYIAPYSCSGGDYWVGSDDDHAFQCPHCEVFNRLILRADLRALAPYFGKTDRIRDFGVFVNVPTINKGA